MTQGTELTADAQRARGFVPAHGDLARSAGVPAVLANEDYVAALARVVYYWGYPAVDAFGRTNMWQIMKDGPGLMLGILPGAPVNTTGSLPDYMSPAQRWVVTPNNDTIYGAGFTELAREPVVVQTPIDVPDHHYWTIQIVDVFTNVIHQLGSAPATPGGKYLLVGPQFDGETPDGFLGILRAPTNVAGVFPRSFATRTPESKAQALDVLEQMGMHPLSADQPGQQRFKTSERAANIVFPPGVTAEMIAADPDASRPQWVNPATFWTDLARMLAANPEVGEADRAMADQARTLVALHQTSDHHRELLDRVALAADVALYAAARYEQVGTDVGNGWQRQDGAGLWGTDWFGRAQAAVIYIFVNDYHEAVYLVRGTDSDGRLLNGRNIYTMTFAPGALPPVDRDRGGFWSLTMYDEDYFMLAAAPGGRTNVGTATLDAGELSLADDGSLTIHLGHQPPDDPAARANWLPAPDDQFALIMRAYVPEPAILDNTTTPPDVQRQ